MREPTNYEKERIRQLLECLTEDVRTLNHPDQREGASLYDVLGTMGGNLEALANVRRMLLND